VNHRKALLNASEKNDSVLGGAIDGDVSSTSKEKRTSDLKARAVASAPPSAAGYSSIYLHEKPLCHYAGLQL
jgi:hypothetical protein